MVYQCKIAQFRDVFRPKMHHFSPLAPTALATVLDNFGSGMRAKMRHS